MAVPDACALHEVFLGKGAISLLHGYILYLAQNHALADKPLKGLLMAHHAYVIQDLHTDAIMFMGSQVLRIALEPWNHCF